MKPARLLLAAAAIILISLTSDSRAEQPRIEVSPDGHTVINLDEQPADNAPNVRFNGVPYLLTPDWQNSLRRQVGGLAVGDLNGDGWADLVVGCYTSNSFPPYNEWENLIYYNVGGALEANPSWVSADERHTGDVLIADTNRDGYPDVVSVNGGTAFAPSVIYHGSATGPDINPDWISSTPQSTWGTAGAAFDFDHDGDIDLFTTNQFVSPTPTRPVYGFRNNGGVLETTPSWQSSDVAIQNGLDFGDYDGDGWEDLAVAKWVNYQSCIYRNVAGALQVFPIWSTSVTSGDRGALFADFDSNGWPDLALGRSPTVMYSNNNGTLAHTWTSTPAVNSNPQDLRTFDFDRDGDEDLAEIQFGGGRVNLYLNTNGALATTPAWSWTSTASGTAVAFGDINGDQWPDLVVGYSGQPCVYVFYARIPAVLGDMNCDGMLNADDVPPFVQALIDPVGYVADHPQCDINRGDINASTTVDGLDIDPFSAALIGP